MQVVLFVTKMKYPKEMWVKSQGCKLSPKKTSELLELTDKIMDLKRKGMKGSYGVQ